MSFSVQESIARAMTNSLSDSYNHQLLASLLVKLLALESALPDLDLLAESTE
jgi:hypothetical protein